jgi:transcription elongation GreA/GreB family factor
MPASRSENSPGVQEFRVAKDWKLQRRARTEYRIVGEDGADPKVGSVSFVSPVAKSLMGKAVGDVVGTSGQELEIISIL